MKSTEEWVEQIWEAAQHLSEEHLHDTELPAIIKAIKLEAMQEGMSKAADIAWQTSQQFADYDQDRDGRMVGSAAYQDIITAARKLTEENYDQIDNPGD